MPGHLQHLAISKSFNDAPAILWEALLQDELDDVILQQETNVRFTLNVPHTMR